MSDPNRTSKAMRILVMNYEYPPVGGGSGRVCQQISEALSHRGHHVVVLTARQGSLPAIHTSGNLTVRRIPACRRRRDQSGLFEMGAYVLSATVAGYWLARRFKPDVIHAHFAVPTGAAAWAIGRSLRIPYVLTAHLGDVPGGVPEQTDRMFRWIYPLSKPIWRDATDATAVSSFVADLASRAYGRRPRIVFNGLDVRLTPPPAIDARSTTPRLIWVGRMQAQKNLLFGLRALALLPDAPWHLDLVGDGPQREAAEALTRELGLSNRVRFHGWLAHEAVQRLMAASNILFLPSLGEGFPVVAVEALSHGLALLCSRIGGLADVARDHVNARTCPVDDPAAYADALRDLCLNLDQLKAMQHASWHIAHEFDLSDIVDAYENTLHQAAITRVQPPSSVDTHCTLCSRYL